jgi:hypothetical protein
MKTKLVWVETPTNPMMKLVDIEAIAKITNKVLLLLIILLQQLENLRISDCIVKVTLMMYQQTYSC